MTLATLPTDPIRAEHRELLPRIEELAHTAASMADAPTPVVREKVARAVLKVLAASCRGNSG